MKFKINSYSGKTLVECDTFSLALSIVKSGMGDDYFHDRMKYPDENTAYCYDSRKEYPVYVIVGYHRQQKHLFCDICKDRLTLSVFNVKGKSICSTCYYLFEDNTFDEVAKHVLTPEELTQMNQRRQDERNHQGNTTR